MFFSVGLGKTEWEDILIEKGIIQAPKDTSIEHHPDIIYDISNNNERDEVDELFSDDEGFLLNYRAKKFEQLHKSNRFGSITEISRSDFLAEVTETSKTHPVLVYLYQTANVNCQILAKWLTQHAAPSHPSIKFVQIQSTRCIQNYPDANLPTILLYRLGTVQRQLLHADITKTQALIEQILEAETETKAKCEDKDDNEEEF